jgi:hypothetical protein
MPGNAGAGDDHTQAPAGGFPSVVEHLLRCAVRRDDVHLARDLELAQHVDGALHHREVGVAAHDDADERLSPCT